MLAAVYHFSYSIPITPFRANFPTTFSWCVCEIGATLSRKNTEQFTIRLWRKRVATTSRKSLLRKLAKRVIYINSWIVYSIVFRTLIHHFRLQPNTPQYAVWYNHRSRTLNILGQVWTMHTSIIHKLVPAFLYGTVSLSMYLVFHFVINLTPHYHRYKIKLFKFGSDIYISHYENTISLTFTLRILQ